MRIERGRLNWGVFFVVLGAVPLAYHQGWLDAATIGGLWRLWPLVLVGIGLGLVLSRTPGYFIGGLVVAACLGLVFGSLFAVGPHFGCDRNRAVTGRSFDSGSAQGISSLDLTLPCGQATIGLSSDSSWHVNTSHAGGADPVISASAPRLSVRAGDDDDWWVDRGWNIWTIDLPARTVTSLSATTDAGDATLGISGLDFSSADFTLNAGALELNIGQASISDFSLTTNAGSAELNFSSETDIAAGTVTTNAGSLKLCVSSDLGLQIRSVEVLAGSNLSKLELVRSGDTWQTQGYYQALHKVNLSATTNAGSLDVRIGGC